MMRREKRGWHWILMPDVQPNALRGCPESWSAGSWSIPEGGSDSSLFTQQKVAPEQWP